MTASIKMNIHFIPGKGGHRILRKGRKPKHARTTCLARVTRLMALSIKYEHLIRKGLVKNHAELAELAGVDRSIISKITRLRLLAPDIQEWLLCLPEQKNDREPVGWTEIRSITRIFSWDEQRRQLNQLLSSKGLSLFQDDGLACGGITKRPKTKEKEDEQTDETGV